MFKPVPTRVDYVGLEHEVQRWWDANDVPAKYRRRNEDAAERWSFIDGPITANNPMGAHHAWGRSYKDLFNRFWTMRGRKLRYQNGFDCQGLWIEVEVEKELGFTSKRDIERYGVAEFVEACKERVRRFAAVQTEQSIRLGYWMDWQNSYYTNSDENNYTIWAFLKKCWQNGWLYKGKDSMPWCPRCGTGISQHEIVTEGYQEITHASVYLKFPLRERRGEALLVWTTTPWTLAANVAAAVHPDLVYEKVRQGGDIVYVSKGARATAIEGEHEVLGEVKGSDLVGLTYDGPFDELAAQAGIVHSVIAWGEVSDAEGTGIVHIAPGAGAEDFALSKEHDLAVIAPLEEDGTYVVGGGFGFLEGRFAGDVAPDVFAALREKGRLYRVHDYTHRYPTCWRCSSELVFRLVDEWFISMDELRHQIIAISEQATWIPEFGKARELDWLRNMHDWMISKKRYYGLALPIYECQACGHFAVIGSETELEERAVAGWQEFAGHSPHRPWVDAVKVACPSCGATVERILDVGNPWLDAGIVPYSTLDYRHDRAYWEQWFPADWVSESFPGQFRNWFYALLAMSAVMQSDRPAAERQPPFRTLFSYALLRDEHGDEMHKSKGNAIWFEDAAERMGADVMRWMFLRQPPASNLNFGWQAGEELKRGFFSTLWNTYSFFVTYANIDAWVPAARQAAAARLSGASSSSTGQSAEGGRQPEAGHAAAARLSGASSPSEGQGAEGGRQPEAGQAAAAPPHSHSGDGPPVTLPEAAESQAQPPVQGATLPGGLGGDPPTSPDSKAEQTARDAQPSGVALTELDRWALSELNQLVREVTADLEGYDSMTATRRIEEFVEALSNWYVRRSRRRFWKSESDADKAAAYETLWTCLATLNRLMAPMTPFLAEEIYQNLVGSWSPSTGTGEAAAAPESVHLCDWPKADAALIDPELSASVRLVQRLTSLGRSARARANVKVRQPLAGVHVKLLNDGEALTVRRLADQIVEELNVKGLDLIDDAAAFFDYQVRPNLPVLGPKYGGAVSRIQGALAGADQAAIARAVAAGRTVELAGLVLEPEELLVTTMGKPGYAVAEEAGYAVAVSTEITPALAEEGLARELVRHVQELRKSAGLEIADRIRLTCAGDADLARVVETHGDYIRQETLATTIDAGKDASVEPEDGYTEEQEIDGHRVRLVVAKA